jgi:hypothetical protein
MAKTPARITRLTTHGDGPISPLSSPGRGIQAAQDATDAAQQAVVRGRPASAREQVGITAPCRPVAAHSGKIDDPRATKPRSLPMNKQPINPPKR